MQHEAKEQDNHGPAETRSPEEDFERYPAPKLMRGMASSFGSGNGWKVLFDREEMAVSLEVDGREDPLLLDADEALTLAQWLAAFSLALDNDDNFIDDEVLPDSDEDLYPDDLPAEPGDDF